jgi:hypothetical protein
MLREVEGFSYDELATWLAVPLGTAKSLVFHGRRLLRERLEPMFKEAAVMCEQTRPRSQDLYPNFTDRARMAIMLAKEEAALRGDDVGIVDLAVGLVELPHREVSLLQQQGVTKEIGGLAGGLGGLLMQQRGISAAALRATRPSGDGVGPLAMILGFAARVAKELSQSYVGTEHLLLGILSQDIGVTVLRDRGLTVGAVRAEVVGRHSAE